MPSKRKGKSPAAPPAKRPALGTAIGSSNEQPIDLDELSDDDGGTALGGAMGLTGALDLTADSQDDEPIVEEAKSASSAFASAAVKAEKKALNGKQPIQQSEPEKMEYPEDSDVEEVDETEARAPAASGSLVAAAGPPSSAAGTDDDDEAQVVGSRGQFALVDFPHSRENCATHPFVKGKMEAKCVNCFCFVCDAAASSCPDWKIHCKATHKIDGWQKARADWKRLIGDGAAGSSGAAGSGAGTSSGLYAASRWDGTRWSCDDILQAIEQVFPVETPEPTGLVDGTVLRPYQKQSIAFMKQVEQATDPKSEGCNSVTNLVVRGGWLADEVGMGKTLVCTALVLAAPAKVKAVTDTQFRKIHDDGPPNHLPIKIKATLIIVNNTLVGQWKDEIAKFAPDLEVHTYYADKKSKQMALKKLRSADIVLTTPHMFKDGELSPALLRNVQWHRLIIDESHLLSQGSTSHKILSICAIKTNHCWLVSGTPFSTSLSQLKNQAAILGIRDALISHIGDGTFFGVGKSNEEVVEWLKTKMIRHTKNMRIGGEIALALPDADCQTVWLTMSDDERLLYGIHECVDGHGLNLDDETRFRAASHLYSERVVTGEMLAYREAREALMHPHPPYAVVTPPDCTLDSPLPRGSFREASAAFLRTHDELLLTKDKKPVTAPTVPSGTSSRPGKAVAPPPPSADNDDGDAPVVKAFRPKSSLTKYQRLFNDLKELREAEPDFRAVIFTRFDEVQKRLVELCAHESKTPGGALYDPKSAALKIYEFNKTTAPTARHRRISEFQSGTSTGAKLFIVTYQTAAVGITLTAASRVFLMEPALDPATEVQAAGRIHRLGQEKDIFIKRYAFKDSIEEATSMLHEKIKTGDVKVRDGRFPPEAYSLFKKYGPSAGLFRIRGEAKGKILVGEGLQDWEGATRRPVAKKGEKPIVFKPSRWKRECTEEECKVGDRGSNTQLAR